MKCVICHLSQSCIYARICAVCF